MALDDPPDADEAHAGAGAGAGDGKFAGGVESLERLEQLVYIGGIEADPVVAHVAADRGLFVGGGGELDGGVVALGGELPGVLYQVLEHGADESMIRGHPDTVLDGEADPAAGLAGSQFGGDRDDLR